MVKVWQPQLPFFFFLYTHFFAVCLCKHLLNQFYDGHNKIEIKISTSVGAFALASYICNLVSCWKFWLSNYEFRVQAFVSITFPHCIICKTVRLSVGARHIFLNYRFFYMQRCIKVDIYNPVSITPVLNTRRQAHLILQFVSTELEGSHDNDPLHIIISHSK